MNFYPNPDGPIMISVLLEEFYQDLHRGKLSDSTELSLRDSKFKISFSVIGNSLKFDWKYNVLI